MPWSSALATHPHFPTSLLFPSFYIHLPGPRLNFIWRSIDDLLSTPYNTLERVPCSASRCHPFFGRVAWRKKKVAQRCDKTKEREWVTLESCACGSRPVRSLFFSSLPHPVDEHALPWGVSSHGGGRRSATTISLLLGPARWGSARNLQFPGESFQRLFSLGLSLENPKKTHHHPTHLSPTLFPRILVPRLALRPSVLLLPFLFFFLLRLLNDPKKEPPKKRERKP